MAQISMINCGLCDSNPSVYHCIECGHSLCKSCRAVHDKFQQLHNHIITSIEDVDWFGLKTNSFMCQIHQREYLHSCLTCKSFICSKCVTTTHKGHEICDSDALYANYRHEAKQWLEKLKKKEDSFIEIQEKARSKDLEIKDFFKSARQQIDHAFSTLMDILHKSQYKAVMKVYDSVLLLRESSDNYLRKLNYNVEKNSNLYKQMKSLIDEKHDQLFYIGYKRLIPELDCEDILNEPDINIPLLGERQFYLSVYEQIKPQIENYRLCQNCKEKEMELKYLSENNAKYSFMVERNEEEIYQLNLKLKETEELQDLKRKRNEEEISQLNLKLKETEEELQDLKKKSNEAEIFQQKVKLNKTEEKLQKMRTERDEMEHSQQLQGHSLSPFGSPLGIGVLCGVAYVAVKAVRTVKSEKGTQTVDLKLEEDSDSECLSQQEFICKKHDQQFSYYCKSHAAPICKMCSSMHDECSAVNPIQLAIDGIKYPDIQKQYEKLSCEGSVLSSNILHLIKIVLSATQNEIYGSPSKVAHKQKRSGSNTGLTEKTQEVGKKEFIDVIKEINSYRKKIEKAEQYYLGSKNEKATKFMALHAYKDQMEICIQKMQTVIVKYIREAAKIEPMYYLDVSVLQTATKELILQYLYRSISLTLSTISSDWQDLNLIHLTQKLNRKIKDKTSKVKILGCTILTNGQIALTDPANDRILFIEGNGMQTQLNIRNKPYGIVEFLNNDIAITLYGQQSVCIMNRKQQQQIKIFKFSECGSLGGIAVADNTLTFRVNGFGFFRIDQEGNFIDKIRIATEDYHMQNFCCTDHKLFFANWNENKVFCSDFHGNIIWTFYNEKVLRAPVGVTVDEQERVYVTGQYSRNVVVISPCGNYFRELVFGLKPCAIHYSLATKQLLVCGFDGQVLLYDVHKGKRL